MTPQASTIQPQQGVVTQASARFAISARRCCIAAILALHSAALFWLDYRNSPTVDEVAHLPSGLSHLYFGDFSLYKVNPPLVRTVAAIPLLICQPEVDWSSANNQLYSRPEFQVGREFSRRNGRLSPWYFTLARWACIPFSLLGAIYCYLWAKTLYGSASGLCAMTLWCISPNILGNASLITPDVAAASTGLTASYYFWLWQRSGSWRTACLAGTFLGIATLTKLTWLLLFAIWPALCLLLMLKARNPHSSAVTGTPNECLSRRMLHFPAIIFIAVCIVNIGYGFNGSFKPLREYDFISHKLGGNITDRIPGNLFSESIAGKIPVPFPADFVQGLDLQMYDFERGKWSYLAGTHKFGGWWYWYSCAVFVKTSAGLLIIAGLVIILRLIHKTPVCSGEVILITTVLALFLVVSSQTGFSRHFRYLLPASPFVFVLVSQCFSTEASQCVSTQFASFRLSRAISAFSVAWIFCSSTICFPHSLSYFNELSGGPLCGSHWLLDANLDWGQDLLFLKSWCDTHPNCRPLYVDYCGFVDLEIAGIEAEPIPGGNSDNESRGGIEKENLDPGWYAISINNLLGYKHLGNEQANYDWLRNDAPVARAGYSIVIYELPGNNPSRP